MNDKIRIGIALTGSFCTYTKVLDEIEKISKKAELVPIFSENGANTDTRFGAAKEFLEKMRKITGKKPITTIAEAEPIGPKKLLDALVIAPCTGNTAAKLAGGIADTAVTLAAKSQLRNKRPVIIAISTNDGLGANAVNIGKLLARKNVFFVPFRQDDCIEKENSLVAEFSLIFPTVEAAILNRQIQPILI